jgi:hypothetical protein
LAIDDAVVEEQRFLVDVLADLEAPHIRLLNQVSVRHSGYGSPLSPKGEPVAHGWSVGDLIAFQPGMAQVVQPLLRVLAGRELIIDTAVGTWGYLPRKSERWIITHTGTQRLELLAERGHET